MRRTSRYAIALLLLNPTTARSCRSSPTCFRRASRLHLYLLMVGSRAAETRSHLSWLQHLAAVYDISARTVYMPNGLKLEAHSGFGSLTDDPG